MSDKIPSLNWLRVFEAAARCESFARAASELNMSAAAVSQQVRALEDRVGKTLFDRHAHSVALTQVGHAYLPSVQQALLTLETATNGLFGTVREQQLFVRSILLFAQGVLSKGYSAFTAAHPRIALTLTTGNQPYEFSKDYNDLQIMFGNPQSFGGESDWLMNEKLYPVAHPDVAATVQTSTDLLQHPLIEVSTHRAGWPHVFNQLGLLPGPARQTFADNTLMAMAIASEGSAIALARAPASDKAMTQAGLVRVLPDFSIDGYEGYHLTYADRRALRPPAKKFRDWIIDYCKSEFSSGV